MKVRTCSKCGADSTLRSEKCYNCGAPLTVTGKIGKFIGGVIVLGVIAALFFNIFFK